MKSVVTSIRSGASRILVVDDAPEILAVTDAVLSAAGYETISYTDGTIALQIMDLLPPDLIILDINMPAIDGYEMTRRIRSNAAWDLVPILLFSALDRTHVALGLECGADDLVSKPVAIEELLGKVNLLLHSRRRQQYRQQQRQVG